MDICPALVADGEPSKAVEPVESVLDDQAVSPEPFVALNVSPGYAWGAAVAAQEQATAWEVVALVRRVAFRDASGADPRLPLTCATASTSSSKITAPWTLAAESIVASGTPFASVSRWCLVPALPRSTGLEPVYFSPFWPVRWPNLSSPATTRCARRGPAGHVASRATYATPASCQALKRRQHVSLLPKPNSLGSISRVMPALRTKRSTPSTARSGMRGRPPFGLGGSGGSSGSITSQSSSLTICVPISANLPSGRLSWF